MEQTINQTAPPTKPKKVLTEAQRLAFLKGREKRMANIERKRQEKLEAQAATANSIPDTQVEPEKPILQAEDFPTPQPVEVKVKVEPDAPIPEKPELKRESPIKRPDTPIPKEDPDVIQAKKIADLIIHRFQQELAPPPPPPIQPKRKYVKKDSSSKKKSKSEPQSADEEDFISEQLDSLDAWNPTTPPQPIVPPQKTFNWM